VVIFAFDAEERLKHVSVSSGGSCI
jgi:hypothetical protein